MVKMISHCWAITSPVMAAKTKGPPRMSNFKLLAMKSSKGTSCRTWSDKRIGRWEVFFYGACSARY